MTAAQRHDPGQLSPAEIEQITGVPPGCKGTFRDDGDECKLNSLPVAPAMQEGE